MTICEYETYIQSIDDMEQRCINDNIYPKIRSSRCKTLCYVISEVTKECIRYFKISTNNNAPKETKSKINNKNE